MAKILPFLAPPEPDDAPPRPSRGLSYTLRVDADEIVKALAKRLKDDEQT